MTTVFDAAGEGSAKARWVLIRRARADKFEFRKLRRKTFAGSERCVLPTRKTGQVLVRTSGTERPVISVVEIRYVRRSEVSILLVTIAALVLAALFAEIRDKRRLAEAALHASETQRFLIETESVTDTPLKWRF